MDQEEFKKRTKAFALRIIKLTNKMAHSPSSLVIGKQLLRCGTSVGANYRAACRAKSSADFVFKMSIVEEECDESMYWMELLIESGNIESGLLTPLMNEANEILSMTVASIKTAKNALNQQSANKRLRGIPNPQSPI